MLSDAGADTFVDYGSRKRGKTTYYLNVPAAFDIETSSFYEKGEKRAIMYEWTFGINGCIMIGRTWEDLEELFRVLPGKLGLDSGRRLLIYVHNLSFEFQWIRKRLEWETVFAIDALTPVYAATVTGLEFRCSYLLSGFNLATLGKNLTLYPVEKMVGDLDYKKIRHAWTPMTKKEIGYCVNDVCVVMSYIQERIETDGNVTRIQLTKTGYVRKYCRDACMYAGSHKKKTWKALSYQSYMKGLSLDLEEYKQAKRAFHGGFTHANAYHEGKTLFEVDSDDFTSSYPAVAVMERRFPVGPGELVRIDDLKSFERYIRKYFCLFDVTFRGICEKEDANEHPISVSKCWHRSGRVLEDNGRVVYADEISTTMTDIDFEVIEAFYEWDEMAVSSFRIYHRGYLPTPLVGAILDLYEAKTKLKGVIGSEQEYQRSKEMLNSCY